MQDIFLNLNKEQTEAVKIIDKPSIILAGAGSGKTRVLVSKVLNLILNHKVSGRKIVMITFTNKAAKEMKERVMSCIPANSQLGFVGTFHSFCAMILRRSGEHIGVLSDFVIYDTDDCQVILKSIIKEINSRYSPSFFMNKISEAKNKIISPSNFLNFFSYYKSSEVADVYSRYQKELKKNMAVDFDDLIMKVVELFENHRNVLDFYQDKFNFFLVDEFQDTNKAQYALTKLLSMKHKKITVVGDFSQSIYSWRGADMQNLKMFSLDFDECVKIKLQTNYRSTQNILDFAYEVINQNETHEILELKTVKDKGCDIVFHVSLNEEEEAVFVAKKIIELARNTDYSDMAVLYRTNAQSRIIEEVFLHFGIPYVLVGGTRFYERKEIKDILSYLRLINNPSDTVSLERIQKLGKKRFALFKELYSNLKSADKTYLTDELITLILEKTQYLDLYDETVEEDYSRLENIKELRSVATRFININEFLEQVALVESEYFMSEKDGGVKKGVKLTTLHQAKGLEYDCVFITGLEEGILPHSRSVDDNFSLEEERRLFYVGITRAKTQLFITRANKRMIFGRRNESAPSRFLPTDNSLISNEITAVDDPEWW